MIASPTRLSCAVIVAFLNEEAYLPAFLGSLERQTRLPDRLLLVDDGSTDESVAICERFAARKEWLEVVRRPKRGVSGDRLQGAPELVAFLWAVEHLTGSEEVVVKMDADLELAPEHVATVLAAMEDDERLGMAGTYLTARWPDGTAREERHPAQHVRGPTRFYRRSCFQEVFPLPTILGWDGADAVRARDRGWTTLSVPLPGEPSFHLRPTGSHDGRLRAFARWGQCAYATGAHPLGVLAAAVMRLRERPAVLGSVAYLWGWSAAHLRRSGRFPEDIRRAERREQWSRLRARVVPRP